MFLSLCTRDACAHVSSRARVVDRIVNLRALKRSFQRTHSALNSDVSRHVGMPRAPINRCDPRPHSVLCVRRDARVHRHAAQLFAVFCTRSSISSSGGATLGQHLPCLFCRQQVCTLGPVSAYRGPSGFVGLKEIPASGAKSFGSIQQRKRSTILSVRVFVHVITP